MIRTRTDTSPLMSFAAAQETHVHDHDNLDHVHVHHDHLEEEFDIPIAVNEPWFDAATEVEHTGTSNDGQLLRPTTNRDVADIHRDHDDDEHHDEHAHDEHDEHDGHHDNINTRGSSHSSKLAGSPHSHHGGHQSHSDDAHSAATLRNATKHKLGAAVVVLVTAVFGAMVPICLGKRGNFTYLNHCVQCLSAGMFLGLAFFHLLSEATHLLEEGGVGLTINGNFLNSVYPTAIIGLLAMFYLEHIAWLPCCSDRESFSQCGTSRCEVSRSVSVG
eukprot:Selendium_serpulae@DN5755_c0_g1_i9.p1